MESVLMRLLESQFRIKVYEIKYVELEKNTSVVDKRSGYKGFADFALSIMKKVSNNG